MGNLKTVGLSVLGLLAFLALGWVLVANDTAMLKVFGPARAEIRRETFEQTKSFRDGVIHELRSMQFTYLKATEDQKPGLASVIKHQAVQLQASAMPKDLADFIATLP
jgi:hypothetical protein